MISVADRAILSAINHVLRQERWALERLRTFSGSFLLLVAPPLRLFWRIDELGCFDSGDTHASPDVTLTFPSDAPARFLIDRESLFSSVKLAGSADLAETLAFVFRNLRWDAEGEMARVFGDIPAHRLAMLFSGAARQVGNGLQRAAENLAEYASEDSALVVPGRETAAFASAVDELRNDVARLEKRIARF